jgi:hypothetical protein
MKLALLGFAALAAIALVTPVTAQEVITNPGKCAQYYPNANCQNLGPGNPYTGGGYRAAYPAGAAAYRGGWRNGYAYMGRQHGRHYHHRYSHH